MITIKSETGIKYMREANRIVGDLLYEIVELIKPGVSTYELDRFAENFILARGAYPGFKGFEVEGLPPFPGSICASVNSCIVHGIPSKKVILKEGDIIGIDVGTFKNGYYGDGARTYAVGKISKEAQDLLDITKEALHRGMEAAKVGARVGDISYAIGSFVRKNGYFVADDLTGHGIGTELHEDPVIPNIGYRGKGPRLRKNMTIAIEPMVNIGTNKVKEKGWEFFVKNGGLSAHFENTILIGEDAYEILTLHQEK